MTKIFISYRRSDLEASAWRLHEYLSHKFGKTDVFIDGADITPGDNFADVLNKNLHQAKVMLVVIDKGWLTAVDDTGRRRLDDPNDYVRHEITTALDSGTSIIPVLIGTTPIPKVNELPPQLAELVANQAISIFHNQFEASMKALADAIKKCLKSSFKYSPQEIAQQIITEFNEPFIITEIGDNYKLQLYFGSETAKSTYFKSHLLKEAIVHLIDDADLTGWMNHPDELQPPEFWEAILRVIAANYRYDVPYPTDDQSDFDMLRQLLGDLERPFPEDEHE